MCCAQAAEKARAAEFLVKTAKQRAAFNARPRMTAAELDALPLEVKKAAAGEEEDEEGEEEDEEEEDAEDPPPNRRDFSDDMTAVVVFCE